MLVVKRSPKIEKNKIIRICLFIFTMISLMFKSVLFLGFTLNKNSYALDLSLGYSSAYYFFNYYAAFILVFMCFYFLFKSLGRVKYLLFTNTFFSIVILVDLWYFRGFNTVPSLTILKQTANLDNLSGSIFSMMSPYDILFIIDIIFMFLLYFLKLKPIYEVGKRKILYFVVIFISCICFIGHVPFTINVLKKEHSKSYLFGMYDPNSTTKFFSPIGYHVFNTYSVWKDSKPLNLSQQDKDEIKEWFEANKENLPDNEYKGLFKGKNLIIIQVESLENFVIGQTVQGKEITPNLNRLLKNSIYFPKINEQVNEGTSSDSDLMVNTSVYPLRQGSTFFSHPYVTYNSLPKLMQAMDYSTVAIHPDKGAFWNWMEGLKNIGFEKCVDYSNFNVDEVIGLGISDESYFKQIVPILENQKQPFYSFMVTLTSHGPFDLPEKYRELGLDKELNSNHLGGYFESVHYTDKQIGMFLDSLDKSGLLDKSVVVITGDHNGVHKYYNDKLAQLKNPEPWWIEITNHIPLIIYQKNYDKPKKIEVTGGQIDTMPTLCYIMGIDEKDYINTVMGRNLLKTNRDYSVLTNRTINGKVPSEEEKARAIRGLDLADKIIKSDYFKEK